MKTSKADVASSLNIVIYLFFYICIQLNRQDKPSVLDIYLFLSRVVEGRFF